MLIKGDSCVLELRKMKNNNICVDVMLFDRSLDNLMDEHGVSCVHALLDLDFELAGIRVASFECGIPCGSWYELFDKLLDGIDDCAYWLDKKDEWRR